ncbi:hypothetical protein A11A3_00395 [Alcanivorax hongdengensis A-11-3]|uniref:RdRp catalytic domain-containing protein n=1 Tax=Alcanivorax hongdengensis A-11-3 TaxID=1177179 RepID=L0WIE1_9GAMM|nr:hypothetical protein [Alcanivorax hongdengensis]EKF75907.1 hypothetical protein A11A3_00395 [Alcanivorax hongdengensis A-11-3]
MAEGDLDFAGLGVVHLSLSPWSAGGFQGGMVVGVCGRLMVAWGATLVVSLAACGGGGSSSGNGVGASPDRTDHDIMELEVPQVAVAPVTLSIQVTDSKGDPVVEPGTITVLDDTASLLSQSQYALSGGSVDIAAADSFTDHDNNGIPDQPASLLLKFDGFAQHLGGVKRFEVVSFGATSLSIALVPLSGSEIFTVNKSSAVLSEQELVAQPGQDDLSQPPSLMVPFVAVPDSAEKPSAAAYLPVRLLAYDNQGNELDTSEVTVTTVAVPAGKAREVGVTNEEGLVQVNNPDALESPEAVAAGVVQGEAGDDASVQLDTLGATQVVINDAAGTTVSRLNPGTPVVVEIELPVGSVNPNTLDPLEPGDDVPVWTRSDDGESWDYMGLYQVQDAEGGRFKVYVPTTHLSWFSISYARYYQHCGARIAVRDRAGQPLPVDGVITTGGGQSAYLNYAYYYAGSGTSYLHLDYYYSAANAGTTRYADIAFRLRQEGDNWWDWYGGDLVAIDAALTSLRGNAQMETDGLVSVLHGVDVCGTDAGTLTLDSAGLVPSEALIEIQVDDARVLSLEGAANYQFLRGIDEGDVAGESAEKIVRIRLVEPLPSGTVSLPYSPVGLNSAVEGVDYEIVGAAGGVVTLDRNQPEVELRIRSLPDLVAENRIKEFQLAFTATEQAKFLSGHSAIQVRGSVIDDDRPVLQSVQADDVAEGEDVVVTLGLDQPLVHHGYVWLNVVPKDMTGNISASPGRDFSIPDAYSNDVSRFDSSEFNFGLESEDAVFQDGFSRIFVDMEPGQDEVTFHLPTLDNNLKDAVGRGFRIEVDRLTGLYEPDDVSSLTTHVAIIDDEIASATAPSLVAVRESDHEGNVPAAGDIQEGADLAYELYLDEPAINDVVFSLALQDYPTSSFMVVRDGALAIVANGDDLVIPAGEQSVQVYLATDEDGMVTSLPHSDVLTITPPAGIAVSGGGPLVLGRPLAETDVTFVSIVAAPDPSRAFYIEGDQASFVYRVLFFANNPDLEVVMSDVVTGDERFDPLAQEGEDFTLSGSAIGTLSGYEDSRYFTVSINDDDVAELPEVLAFNTSIVSGLAENPKNPLVVDGRVIKSRVTLFDDDDLRVSTRDRAFELTSNGAFSGAIKVSVEISAVLDRALSFDVALKGTELPFDAIEKSVTIPAGEQSAEASFSLSGASPASLGLSEDSRTLEQVLMANISLTDSAKDALRNASNMGYVVTNSDAYIGLSFTYTGQDSSDSGSATGATGGTGGGGAGVF